MPEIPKGYKQTEVGVIPEEWEVSSLDDVCLMKSGESITAARIDTFSPFPCYGGNGIRGYTSRFTHDGDYALIGRQGALCGNVVAVSGKFFASEHAVVVTPRSGTDIRFLTYVLGEMRLNRYSESSAQPGLSVSKVLMLPVATPTTDIEQEAIAAALSDADAWIESLEKLIEKQRAVKQGAMQALLTPPGQPGHQRLPGFKGAWKVKRLGDVVSPRTDRLDPTSVTDTTFCVELEHMISGTGMLTNDAGITGGSSLKSIFHPGDVLYGKLRAYLRKFWFADRPGVCSTEIWVLAADTLILRPEYLYQVVQSNFFLDATNTTYGTHMPRSDWNVVRELKLSLPKLPEQAAIASVLSDLDAEVEALEAKLAKARQIKQGMMQELLTGRVRLV